MKKRLYVVIFVLSVIGCKKPYSPPAITANNNYLVVEGTIVNGPDSTIIKLSRTVNLSVTSTLKPELNALVAVQNDQNDSYPLKVTGAGLYATASISLDVNRTYRLDIKTSDGKEYASDLVVVKNSPPIDSITYEDTGLGENLYSYTHDATNNTRYYRWDYSETYLYNTPIISNYIYKNGDVVERTAAEQVHTCYIRDSSSNIILNSSAKLQQDIIAKNPITQVPFSTDKLVIRYSLLVKQYALTPAAYDFYTNLAKNTEKLGSIFDAQPSEISGNIHCLTVPSEPVLGYISAGVVAQKRIFVDRSQIPTTSIGVNYDYCGTAVFEYKSDNYIVPAEIIDGFLIPLDTIRGNKHPPQGPAASQQSYSVPYATPDCTVCTLKGSTTKPPFWQ